MSSNFAIDHGIDESELKELETRSRAAMKDAYCPYSSFHVGCCILTTNGEYITGANVENASYPCGVCAERTAFVKAITSRHRSFKAMAVATNVDPPASPCGMCRQTIREFCPLKFPIFMFGSSHESGYVVCTMEELLPLSFGPEKLLPKRLGTAENETNENATLNV